MVSSDTKLTLYGNWVSQPSRTIWAFADITGIAYEKRDLDLFSREHKTPEYLAINPAGAVPAMVEETPGQQPFALSESHAVLRYLARSRGVADHWYPADLRKRAIVEK